VTVEARSVNQRFLDVRVRLPPPLIEHATAVEEVARKQLVRGRVEISARLDGSLSAGTLLDRERAKAAFRDLRDLRDELDLEDAVPLALLGAVPGLFVERVAIASDAVRDVLRTTTHAACQQLSSMRRTEGAALRRDLEQRVARLLELNAKIGERRSELDEAHRERLRGRIRNLVEGTQLQLDPGRLELEVALLADRADVSEEITRLASHCQQFAALLGQDDEPVGRKLEFLLQEMGREVNTLGSKVSDLAVTGCVLEQKTELERLREQVQNVL
jgi:uncharacterized protein (TIGR00255 family)